MTHHPRRREHSPTSSSAEKHKALATDPPTTLVVGTLAGTGQSGSNEGLSATFNVPAGVAIDAAGNVYVADKSNHLIRMITTSGVTSLFAGNGAPGFNDGASAAAQFFYPAGVAVDTSGNVYVADSGNQRIRKITTSGQVSTLAGSGLQGFAEGPGSSARFNSPGGIAVDTIGNIYVADTNNHRIRKISPSGLVSTLAGNGMEGFANGPGIFAQFSSPSGVAVDLSGTLYVADGNNHRIRMITLAEGVTTLAGSGIMGFAEGAGAQASFNTPAGVAVDATGNVYVADRSNFRIRTITPSGTVSTLAGNGAAQWMDGPPQTAAFNLPCGIAVNAAGNFIIADTANNRIRTIAPPVQNVTTYAGNGVSGMIDSGLFAAEFAAPTDITFTSSGELLVTDSSNHRIRKISIGGGQVTTVAGSGNGLLSGGYLEGPALSAQFKSPAGCAMDAAGNIYVADNGNERIRKITPARIVSTLAGNGNSNFADGPGTSAMFRQPTAIIIDSAGNLIVTDAGNHRIRMVTPAGVVSTLAGSGIIGTADGAAASAQFQFPNGIAMDAAGNIYIADNWNHRIRRLTPAGVVSTIAGSIAGFADGTGTSAMFNHPTGLKIDASGNLYVADQVNHRIRKITPAGIVTTVAGAGIAGYFDGKAPYAQFNFPAGLAFDTVNGFIYVADLWNNRIRKIQ
ncbi:MAG TPA: hypothetical protein VK563_00295 [Puia sp.]|nr:hypothetical protein [Puia sp.]